MSVLKAIERSGRRLLVHAGGLVLGVRRRPIELGPQPRILVVRLDERLGNLLLLTPLLDSLKQRFPAGEVDVLVNRRGEQVLAGHPAVTRFLPFAKKALLSAEGPFRTVCRLRRRHYDLAIDAANPTDPSTTQALLTRFAGARHTVGPDQPGFGRLYSAPVVIVEPGHHEIDLRLQLLQSVPGVGQTRAMSLPTLPARRGVTDLVGALAGVPFGVLNVGARLAEKQLSLADYGAIVMAMVQAGLRPLVTYGPGEDALAAALGRFWSQAIIAPPTGIADLAALMRKARVVISCDTGPMHLAVAVGVPTCGIFVVTDPARYGHARPPHCVIDARGRTTDAWLPELVVWLKPPESVTVATVVGPRDHSIN